MLDPIYHEYDNEVVNVKDEDMGIDFSKIVQDESLVIKSDGAPMEQSSPKRRRKNVDTSKVITTNKDSKDASIEPYEKKYEETNLMLRVAINQLDAGLNDINSDVTNIRSSKTLKRKYDYLSMLQNTASSMVGNKIAAIREINSSISKAVDFELKRAKELKLNEVADNDKIIQDMYQAFVTAPNSGSGYTALGPSTLDMTIPTNNINPVAIGQDEYDTAYNNYVRNMSPQQHMIALENDPNIRQVVIWNRTTGAKTFEIMNMTTGEILENVDKHDIMFMEDTTLDPVNRMARNTKLNESYPLVIIGDGNIDEY